MLDGWGEARGRGTWVSGATGQMVLCVRRKKKDSSKPTDPSHYVPGVGDAWCHHHANGISSLHAAYLHQLPYWETTPVFAPLRETSHHLQSSHDAGESSMMKKSHLRSFFTLGSVHPSEVHLQWLRCQAWFELRGQRAA